MQAAVFNEKVKTPGRFLEIEDVPRPQIKPGYILLRVVACGVCRTDLHIVEGDLAPLRQRLIPGHQIVGEIVEGETDLLPLGMRVGVSWMGGTDGTCPYCKRGMENLCDQPIFTGYTVDGGYAVTRNLCWYGKILFIHFQRNSMQLMWRRFSVRGSSDFGVCVWPVFSQVTGLDCLVLEAPRH
jgi:hypothetical protein